MQFFKLQIPAFTLLFLMGCMPAYVPPAGPGYGQNLPSQQPYYGQNYQQQGYQQQYQQPGYQQQPQAPPIADDNYYDDKRINDDDRDEVMRDSRRRHRDDTCEDENRDHECHDFCREIYKITRDREDCEGLSVTQIDHIYDVHEYLKNPGRSNLSRVELEDLDVYLNISIAGFDRLIRDYDRGDAEEILLWIAEDSDVAELFRDEDDEYRTFESLLREATTSFSTNEVDRPFTEDLDGDITLFEAAIEGSETALEWFYDYVLERASQCSTPVSKECLIVFCKIGDNFEDDRNRNDWIRNSPEFEDYIDDIIEAGIGGSTATTRNGGATNDGWNNSASQPFEDADGLLDFRFSDKDDWVDFLCQGDGMKG